KPYKSAEEQDHMLDFHLLSSCGGERVTRSVFPHLISRGFCIGSFSELGKEAVHAPAPRRRRRRAVTSGSLAIGDSIGVSTDGASAPKTIASTPVGSSPKKNGPSHMTVSTLAKVWRRPAQKPDSRHDRCCSRYVLDSLP